MALDSDRDDVTDRTADRQADARDPSRTAMGGKAGQRQAAHDTDADDAPDPREAELERMRAALKKANREAAEHRRRLDEIEAAKKAEADAALPELERARKQMEDIQAERDEYASALETLATENFRLRLAHEVHREARDKTDDVELLMAVLDLDLIEEDEDTGKFKGIDRAIKAAIDKHPKLAAQGARAGTPPVPSGGGTPPRRPVNGNAANGQPFDARAYLKATGAGGF